MAKGRTILVVEDEPSLRIFVVKVLEMAGHLVLSAENAEETMEIWERVGRAVDLVVTDVIKPGLDGIELARQLRENRVDLKVLFVTGSLERVAEIEALGDATGVVKKPFAAQELRNAVEDIFKGEE